MKIALAGSTKNTQKLAQALSDNQQTEIIWILTPAPKLKGRKKNLTPNPLHQWAKKHQVPTILIKQTQLNEVKDQLIAQETPDILLVADFGYYLPQWLLDLPSMAPVNVHPSKLPQWRGSSPGQFVILSGAKTSAVSFIIMNKRLDQGPIIDQFEFTVGNNWTSTDYYEVAFELASQKMGQVIDLIQKLFTTKRANFKNPLLRRSVSLEQSHQNRMKLSKLAKGRKSDIWMRSTNESVGLQSLKPDRELATQTDVGQIKLTPQPLSSPTPLARKLTRDDGFVDWVDIKALMQDAHYQTDKLPYLFVSLIEYFPEKTALATYVERASRALYPWPTLWTLIPTKKGGKRMKLLQVEIKNQQLKLIKVQIEGQQPALFNQVKNLIKVEKQP